MPKTIVDHLQAVNPELYEAVQVLKAADLSPEVRTAADVVIEAAAKLYRMTSDGSTPAA